jgi:hypothetical protein
MDGWTILVFGATCFVGTVVYLKGVANEVDSAQIWLRLLEQSQRAARRRRTQDAAKAAHDQALAA